ncbi:MAG: hypothetical protein AB7D51_02560 [Desulfovibrionaceae bacterium]
MIDRARAENDVAARAARLRVGGALSVACYKGDRTITITRTGEDEYALAQRGFDTMDHHCDSKNLKKLLKKLFRREFPRSNRLRVG